MYVRCFTQESQLHSSYLARESAKAKVIALLKTEHMTKYKIYGFPGISGTSNRGI